MLKFSLNKQILHTSESVMKGCSGGDMRVCVCVCMWETQALYVNIIWSCRSCGELRRGVQERSQLIPYSPPPDSPCVRVHGLD